MANGNLQILVTNFMSAGDEATDSLSLQLITWIWKTEWDEN